MATFEKAWGVGERRASAWFNAGLRTIQDALQQGHLSAMEKLGLTYYDDLLQRIPAAEVSEAEGLV